MKADVPGVGKNLRDHPTVSESVLRTKRGFCRSNTRACTEVADPSRSGSVKVGTHHESFRRLVDKKLPSTLAFLRAAEGFVSDNFGGVR